jgi:hypothetical protein
LPDPEEHTVFKTPELLGAVVGSSQTRLRPAFGERPHPHRENGNSIMLKFSKKTIKKAMIVTAATAAATITGVATAGSAYASSPSVQLQVCNNGSNLASADLNGFNQNGAWSYGSFGTINNCTQFTGWWWRTGQAVQVRLWLNSGSGWRSVMTSCYIPAYASNGSYQTCRYYY